MSEVLSAIKKWRQEAAKEDHKYFYIRDDFDELLQGEKFIVSGRKGSGKTATLKYIEKECHSNSFPHISLSARDLDFHSLSEISKNPAQAEGFWREILLSTTISALNTYCIQNQELTFASFASQTLSDLVNFLQKQEIDIQYKGFKFTKTNSQTWQERAFESKQLLRKITEELSKPIKIFITIDRLDAAFRHDNSEQQRTAYLRLVEGLLSAAQEIHESNPIGNILEIMPIILIRSDILNLVSNNDKTKWEDETIDLVWNGHHIRKLLAHRLSVAAYKEGLNFDSAWHEAFERFTIKDRYENNREKSSFDYIEFRTSWSPRDYIVYLRECAKFSLASNEKKVSYDRMVKTEYNYSAYVRKQLVDEGLPHIPNLTDRLEQISVLAKTNSRKRNFNLTEFSDAMTTNEEETHDLLTKLYFLNAVGNLHTGASGHPHNRYKFRYKDQFFGSFDYLGSIVIHPGIYRSLT